MRPVSRLLPLVSFALVLAATGPASAHGVWTETAPGGATRVTVSAANGAPLVGAPFVVTAPPDGRAVESGRTDADGRFVFAPDRPGLWRVRIGGRASHAVVIAVPITAEILAGRSGIAAAAHLHGARVDSVAAVPDSLLGPGPTRRDARDEPARPPG